jgi:hypothetical protein
VAHSSTGLEAHATGGHPATERAKSRPKPPEHPQNGPAIVQPQKAKIETYPSLNAPKAPPDPDADRQVRAFFMKMMPNHPMLQDDD